eukprot:Trichotokara_eunicae@DN6232_c0_g1_i2.p1
MKASLGSVCHFHFNLSNSIFNFHSCTTIDIFARVDISIRELIDTTSMPFVVVILAVEMKGQTIYCTCGWTLTNCPLWHWKSQNDFPISISISQILNPMYSALI